MSSRRTSTRTGRANAQASGQHADADRTFADYYRCPADFASLGAQGDLGAIDGYFRFGDAIAFGRIVGASPSDCVTDRLADVSDCVTISEGRPWLPFDFSQVVTNLREERYRQNGRAVLQRATNSKAAQRLYYLFRPLLRVGIRRHLQKVRLSGWQKIAFPQWPVDATVDALMASAMTLVLKATGQSRIPFIWFWPDQASACAIVTHDVEGPTGLDFCDALMDIDDSHGMKSAFQLVPQGREDAWRGTAERLRRRGFEVNLHDLNHDGRLFDEKEEFLRRADRINRYAREFGCEGFRSAVMYRDQSWFDAFDFRYDMSVPSAAHLEPQRGGCCTVMPYFVGDILELPLTTAQDYTLFHILNDYSTTLWRAQIDLIRQRHGLISVITHPDYLTGQRERDVYADLLRHLGDLREQDGLWIALPGEVNRWWRNRRAMKLVRAGDGWRIEGSDRHRARVAYASLEDGRLTYSFGDFADTTRNRQAMMRA